MTYQWYYFDQLTLDQLHELLYFRQEVFVIEQNCPYLDIDGLDPYSWHLLGRNSAGKLVAYLRVVPPGRKFEDPSIGRVVTSKEVRGRGIGRELMRRAIEKSEELFPNSSLRLSAQLYARGFYQSFGFSQVSEPYDEDGILHIDMIRKPENNSISN